MLRTSFTDRFGLGCPIALAPMGGCAGGALAAAVSNAGGLGLIGGGREDPAWLACELDLVERLTQRPWGIGFQSWSADVATVERAIAWRPHAVMLSFGDPRPLAEPVRRAGIPLIVQVTDLDEAARALEVGADVLVAQGGEAGGHHGRRWSTLPFVPLVVDIAAPRPVLAAGGIADGRGLAAALVLGAAGALIGTRFQATEEALTDAATMRALLEGSGEQTESNRVLDIARGVAWPDQYPARTLRNGFLDRWRGREAELAQDEEAKRRYRDGPDDPADAPIWASEAIDLITDAPSAGSLVSLLVREAEQALRGSAPSDV